MDTNDNHRKIINKILTIIDGGFTLSRPECHFISSSFSVSTAEELRQMIDDDDSDIDMISELVIAPDRSAQEGLELFLGDACFSKKDEKEIAGALCKEEFVLNIFFPGDTDPVVIVPDDYLLQRFIQKLRITFNPDISFSEASKELSDKLKLRVLVRIRNSSVKYNRITIEFLSDLLQQEALREKGFYRLFDFAVTLLEENGGKLEIKELFISKKRSYEKTIATIREVNKQLETSAIETLMMQGTRVPPVSEEEIESKIEMIAIILSVIFGHTDIPDQNPSEVNLGLISDKKDIKKVFRILS